MNWREALIHFYNSFDLSAYPEDKVPDDVKFPWLTFSSARGNFGDATQIFLKLHYHTESEKIINDKADEICKRIRNMLPLRCDEGALYLTTGSPEWVPIPTGTIQGTNDRDFQHRSRAINVTINWLTI